MRTIIAFALAMFVLANCKEQQLAIPLSVQAKDHEQKPVAHATVLLNGVGIGFTDQNGLFKGTIEAPLGAKILVQVQKENAPDFYFSPYQQTLSLTQDDLTKQVVEARLFSVPKLGKPEEQKPALNVVKEDATPQDSAQNALSAEESDVPDEPKAVVEELLPMAPAAEVKAHEGALITIHTYSSSKPVPGTEVQWGLRSEHVLRPACVTNERGRCSFRMPNSYLADAAEPPVLFLRRANFQTMFESPKITDNANLLFELKHGESLDVQLFSRAYGLDFGEQGAGIFVNGTQMGETNAFGYFSYVIESFEPKPVNLVINASQFSPEVSDLDIPAVKAGLIRRLVKPKLLVPPRIRLMEPTVRVNDLATAKSDLESLDKKLKPALEKALAGLLTAAVEEGSAGSMTSITLVPSLYVDKTALMEVSLTNHKGDHIAGILASIERSSLKDGLVAFANTAGQNAARIMPYQATVIGVAKEDVSINLGKKHFASLKAGDRLQVYTPRYEEQSFTGLKQASVLKVKEVWNDMSLCEVADKDSLPVKIGDTVVLNDPNLNEPTKNQVVLTISDQQSALDGARVYIDGVWAKTSGANGKAVLAFDDNLKTFNLTVLHPDFLPFQRQDLRVEALGSLSIQMQRRQEMFRLESEPSGAAVTINGKARGKTPLDINLQEEALPLTIVASGLAGYKQFEKVMTEADLEKLVGTVQRFALVIDPRNTARRLMLEKKFTEAIHELERIPATDPDHLFALHDIGEIYLQKLNDPAKAATAFAQITTDPSVANFSDKRFLSAFMNEAIATFLLAERTGTEDTIKSTQLYRRAAEVLSRVQPMISVVPTERRSDVAQEVEYYLALTKHKLWSLTKDASVLADVKKTWELYLKNNPPEEKNKTVASYVENAKTYLRQAEATDGKANEPVTTR